MRNTVAAIATPEQPLGQSRMPEPNEAFSAIGSDTPGTLAWMRALVAAWRGQRRETPSAAEFVRMLQARGVSAEVRPLRSPQGRTQVVVQAYLGEDSETTQGVAVIDPDHGHVFTSPDGKMAHPEELRRWPDWVAAERCPDRDTSGADEWTLWSDGPRAMNFMIGDVCNMHCIMCWNDLRRRQQPSSDWHPETKASTIRHILERHLDSVDSVELVSYGEPMANPEFDEIVHTIEQLGQERGRALLLNVITNGSLLHRRRHSDVVRQPGYLTFSIDAADQQTYEFIREGGRWRDVANNLRSAVRHPERHAERKVGINMTVFEPNVDGVFAMGAFAAGLGVDYLSILHGAHLRLSRAEGMEIDRQDPRLVSQLDRIQRSFPWLQLNDYATARTLPALPAATLPNRGFCPLPWRQFDVGPDGRAHPCCRSYPTDLGTAAEAWNGEPMRELRRQILAGSLDAERCATCAACPNLGIPGYAATSPKVIPLRAT